MVLLRSDGSTDTQKRITHGRVAIHRIRIQLCIWRIKLERFGALGVNHAVDDGVGDVDALGSEFSCKRLRESAERKFACCK